MAESQDFNNLVLIIQTSDNQYLVDNILKMVFLNFTVKDRIVLSHQFNPDFLKYVKVKSVMSCRHSLTDFELLLHCIKSMQEVEALERKVAEYEQHAYSMKNWKIDFIY